MKIKICRRGISLIVLVITIIVMIIIASAIILSLNGSNIIKKSNKAKMSSDTANMLEGATAAYAEYIIKIGTEEANINGITADQYAKEKLKDQGFSEEKLLRLKVHDDGTIDVKYPLIPEGFTVSNIAGEMKVSEGVVIYEGEEAVTNADSDENGIIDVQETRDQYVWVPVDDIDEFIPREGYYNGTKQTFLSKELVYEPYDKSGLSATKDLTEEFAEYAKMKESVEKYGGFYIGRYEVGTTTQRTSIEGGNGTSLDSNGNFDVMIQKGKFVYNFVGWGPNINTASGDVTYDSKNQGKGAVEISRSIYPEDGSYDVVSTLVYGIQWDAVMNFMKDIENPNVPGSKYIENATGMGYYITGSPTKTGASDSYSVKNIYDMAGNVQEWTMEGYYNSADKSTYRVVRSSTLWSSNNPCAPASFRGMLYPNNAFTSLGFRVALYIK